MRSCDNCFRVAMLKLFFCDRHSSLCQVPYDLLITLFADLPHMPQLSFNDWMMDIHKQAQDMDLLIVI